jgi:hypothetical protein
MLSPLLFEPRSIDRNPDGNGFGLCRKSPGTSRQGSRAGEATLRPQDGRAQWSHSNSVGIDVPRPQCDTRCSRRGPQILFVPNWPLHFACLFCLRISQWEGARGISMYDHPAAARSPFAERSEACQFGEPLGVTLSLIDVSKDYQRHRSLRPRCRLSVLKAIGTLCRMSYERSILTKCNMSRFLQHTQPSEALPQTDEACILKSHSGGTGSLV